MQRPGLRVIRTSCSPDAVAAGGKQLRQRPWFRSGGTERVISHDGADAEKA